MIGITIRHLRYFEALAQQGHFGRAADVCAISQPALSLQMKELEALLGAPLIERGARQIRLTALGEDFALRVRDILRAVPVGVLARPGVGVAARSSVAARAFGVNQIARGENLRGKAAPAWCFVNMPMKAASSSAIRARGDWKR